MAAIDARRRPRPRHPRRVKDAALAYLVVVHGEHARRPARRGRCTRWPSCSPSSARSTCTCCRRRRPRADRSAREGVLGRQGERRRRHRRRRRAARVDPRVPGHGSPRSPQASGVVDRRLRPRRRRQRAPLGVPARRRGAAQGDARRCSPAGMALGGAISGEHGIGTEKKQYFLELEDPAKIALMRRIKAAFDPARHPQPRHASSTDDRVRTHDHERRAGPHPHARRQRRRRVLHQPRHVGDALRRRARRRARDARRARACSRASPPARPTATAAWPTSRRRRCCTSGPASATASPTCTTPAGPARRSSTSSATTPPTTSSTTRRSTSDIETRGAQRVGVGPHVGRSPDDVGARRRRRGRRGRGPPGQVATLILPADVSWSEGARAGRAASPPRTAAGRRPTTVDAVAKALRVGRAGRAAARRRRAAASAALRRRQPRRQRHRREAAGRDVPRPARARRRAARRSSGSATWPSSRALQLDGLRHLVLVDAKPPVSFFAYPGQAERPRARRLRGARRSPAGDDDVVARARPRWPTRSARRPTVRASQPAQRPTVPTGALTAEAVAEALGALLPEGAIVVRRGATRRACSRPGATAGAPRTTG